MGFAWYVDGAHALHGHAMRMPMDVNATVNTDELEPTIVPPNAKYPGLSCDHETEIDCPSPRYHLNGVPITSESAFGEDFVLDDCKLLN